MQKPLLATKLRNELKAIDPTLDVALKNVKVNGSLLGCTGFVTDPATGRVIYVSTDNNHGTNTNALYRNAEHTKDYRGGRNRFATYEDVARAVVDLFRAAHDTI